LPGGAPREVIFEITQIGGVARVAAVDVATGLEAIVQGPANAARADLEALALRKLERMLAAQDGSHGDASAPPRRPGKLI
jgi:hypothetical protein